MDGATLAAGAVAAVSRVRNPIRAARAVLEGGQAVMLAGPAADAWAEAAGLAMVPPDYFTAARRVDALASLKARGLTGTLAKASEAREARHGRCRRP